MSSKSLRTSIRALNFPDILQYSNLFFTIFWLIMIFPTVMWWKSSILWVAMMSIWANIASHFAGYIAARFEKTQKEGHNLTPADMAWIRAQLKLTEPLSEFPGLTDPGPLLTTNELEVKDAGS